MDKALPALSVPGWPGLGKEGGKHAEEKREHDGGDQAAGEDHALMAVADDLAAARFIRGIRRALRCTGLAWGFANHDEKNGLQPAKFRAKRLFVT
jgi:hypothetical protein